jgi:MoxR-like ATPase
VTNNSLGAEGQRQVAALEAELAGIIVGQRNMVRGVLTAMLAGGHVLLEGVPGLGKTLLVRTLAGCVDLSYSRIQFTPDLMPADIIGTDVLTEGEDGRRFTFQPGPIFAHLILADEINRATPRTQSAMLEAMQEHMVTVGRQTHYLPEPFFVLATQNPIDLQGTYPLPEAQLDRFFFKLIAGYPRPEELKEIARRTTGSRTAQPRVVLDGESLQRLQEVVRDVPIAEPVLDYAARLVMATHPEGTEAAPAARQYVRYGASPRAIQALILAGKINAILSGRYNVAYEDLRRVMLPALRHRLVLNIEAQLQNVDADAILQGILEEVKP